MSRWFWKLFKLSQVNSVSWWNGFGFRNSKLKIVELWEKILCVRPILDGATSARTFRECDMWLLKMISISQKFLKMISRFLKRDVAIWKMISRCQKWFRDSKNLSRDLKNLSRWLKNLSQDLKNVQSQIQKPSIRRSQIRHSSIKSASKIDFQLELSYRINISEILRGVLN